MIVEYIQNSINTQSLILKDKNLLQQIDLVTKIVHKAFSNGNKIMMIGNGGSASDCEHLATEFVSKFFKDRKALNAIALTSNSASITALSNDFGYEWVFSRQIEAIGKENDILFALSTSGESQNIINAINTAKKANITVIGLTGNKTCSMDDICDVTIKIPSEETPIIQESHVMLGHLICKIVEEQF